MRLLPLIMAACLGLAAADRPSGRESLLIGPGDTLQIGVLEAPELTQTARVTDEGEVPLMLGGAVRVAGMTPEKAAQVIAARLTDKQYIKDPHVSVGVVQYATQAVSVLGQVKAPGSYTIATPRSIVDLLALAGGLTDSADRHLSIQRGGTGEEVHYFLSNAPSEALAAQVQVYPGDRVLIPKASFVYVLGDVARPGGYPMITNDSGLTVLQAVALAGSTLNHAVPSHTKLIRKNQDGSYVEREIPLGKMQRGKVQDVRLEADDILYIPFSYGRNVALGIGGIVQAAESATIYRF